MNRPSPAHATGVVLRGIPELGQLVEVRRRQWIVAEIDRASTSDALGNSQNIVTLASLDEDSLGERLDVLWEIEPGAHVIERAGLPRVTGRDDTEALEAFIDAVRWGAATNADRGFLQAPFRSGASIEDFQLDPLVRAIDMARVNILIADDVGLGKTIEAGLVVQELLLRHRARSVLIVCPASLQEKWRTEMLEKFGLEFEIVDTDYIKVLRRERGIHANPWSSAPRLITSVDWLKAGEPLRLLSDILPVRAAYPRTFDILIVDEAHNVAPAGSAHYAVDSQRTRLIRRIAPHFQHRLFLTATPHNGYRESFTALLELLDDQRFSRSILPDEKRLGQVMVRRLKSELTDKNGNPLFPKRMLHALEVPFTFEERNIQKLLNAYCKSRDAVGGPQQRHATTFVNELLKKRLLSSPAAFASTLEKHYRALNEPRKRAPDAIARRILRTAIAKADEDYADDRLVEEAHAEAVEEASEFAAPLTPEQREMLERLRASAQENANKPDTKANAIAAWIDERLRPGGKWNDRRVILFTEYRTTQQWLQTILSGHGCGGDRLAIIHGGIDHEDRERIKAAFQADPADAPVRILLATDAASEGIDLQNHCDSLIHIEIPYNPNVMEQRNGRIDRHGQKSETVDIWHPVDGAAPAGEAFGGHKDDILRALNKLEAMRADMGSVNPIIAPQMAGLIEGTRRELDTKEAELRAAKARRFLHGDRQIKERIEALHARLEETERDFHLSPARIYAAVKTALALAEKPPLTPVELAGAPSGTVFSMPAFAGSWAKCLKGLEHPYTGKLRPITFDHSVAADRDDVVLVHLNHRLVRMALQLLRAEVWAQTDVQKLHRVDIRRLPAGCIEDIAVVVISRLVVTGGNHHRLHEELTYAGGYLKDASFARETRVSTIDGWMQDAVSAKSNARLFDGLKRRFDKHRDAVLQTALARSKDRLRTLENTLEIQKRREIEDIAKILDELAEGIKSELNKGEEPEQLPLFSEDERLQLKRNMDALRARLDRIPEERLQETDLIETRFRNPDPKTFPIAVVFLVPENHPWMGTL